MSIRLQSPPESWQSAYIESMIIITLGLSIIFIDSVFMIISTMESTFAWPPLHARSYPLPTPFDGLVHAQQTGLYDVSVTEFRHSYYSLLAHTFDCFCRFILIALYCERSELSGLFNARIFYIIIYISGRTSCRKCSKCLYVYLNIRPVRYSARIESVANARRQQLRTARQLRTAQSPKERDARLQQL